MIQVGDRVVCVDASKLYSGNRLQPKLVEGRDYIVYGIMECDSCGATLVDVGLETLISPMYCSCNKLLSNDLIHWCHYKRFRKIEPEYKAVMVDSEISEQAKELIGITETIAR